MNRRRTAVAAATFAAGLVTLLVPPLSPSAAQAPAEPARAAAAPQQGYHETRTLSRTMVNADGSESAVTSYDVTVNADEVTDLRGRERVEISWTGAPPSGGRASNPYGENGLQQEYPVVVLQCRGLDDPDLPVKKQVSPETCWTSSFSQRSQTLRSRGEATWTVDHYADDADKQAVSGLDPFPSGACPNMEVVGYYTHITPFVTAAGETFPACSAETMPPEAAVGSAFPPSEIAAFSDLDGDGSVQFEVRSDVENQSLGCNDKVACSIVVIPIVGVSCQQAEDPQSAADRACRQYGEFAPGSTNYANNGADQAVSPSLWWAESNWRNRFSIPITFGLPPDACDVLDPRPPTGFYGSELMAQAALQWAPAYCLNQERFKFQLNQMPDATGWSLMETGGGPAAFVSSAHETTGDPVGYAPTAVTGFSIGYIIDKPDNAGEYTELRLTPRLIAKLLTQSYLGSALGADHPGIKDNPWAIMTDPEFVELNPGLTDVAQEAGATLLSLSNSSDIVRQLTEYIAQDKDAMDFISGEPDEWGMRVNPAYQDLELPRDDWPLLDTYVPDTEDDCRKANPSVYFTQLAAPVTTLRKISDALIDAWPNVQSKCVKDTTTGEFKTGRIDRQAYGARFMLGIVSLGDAERYGLRTAALRTTGGAYVEPTPVSIAKAVSLMKQEDEYGPFAVDADQLVEAKSAYPGTMLVYTAARLANLAQEDADKVAQFIRISTTEGQQPGRGNGNLPDGYLPIRKTGVTADLYDAAQETAEAIEKQVGQVEPEPPAPTTEPAPAPETTEPTDEPPAEDKGPKAGPKPVEVDAAPVSATTAVSSGTGKLLLPTLLVVGLLAAASSIVSRLVGGRRE